MVTFLAFKGETTIGIASALFLKKYYLFGQFQFLNIKKVENLRMFNVYGFDICFNNKSHLIDEKKY